MARRKMTDAEKTEMKRKKEEKNRLMQYKNEMKSSFEKCKKSIDRGDIRTPPYEKNIK